MCLHWFTDGALYCERCRRQPAVEKMWYCLWWREEDGAPLLTICRNAAADFVKELKYGEAIYCGKVDKLSSNFLKPSGIKQKFTSGHPLRQREVEILPTLLMVWTSGAKSRTARRGTRLRLIPPRSHRRYPCHHRQAKSKRWPSTHTGGSDT